MYIINDRVPLVEMVAGKQKVSLNTEYRWMKYCHIMKYKDVFLIFNNLTKEFVALNTLEYTTVKSEMYSPSSEIVISLLEKWFLVPQNYEENILAEQLRKLAKSFLNDGTISKFNILTTTNCNARCFYCYEAGITGINMSAKTAVDVAEFIVKHHGKKDVEIQWFGGEPLCNVNAINIISDYLIEQKINFKTSMVSNGYLFDEEIIKLAREKWNLLRVQITLDGMEDTYNRVKNYKATTGSAFKKVILNIHKLLKADISVCVRMNMDKHNEDELYNLTDYLYEEFSEYKKFSLYARMIFENVGFEAITRSDIQRQQLAKKLLKLFEHIDNYGLLRISNMALAIQATHCMADDPGNILITPEGKISNCEHCLEHDLIGSIYDNCKIIPWNDYYPKLTKCDDCVLYPSCFKLKGCESVNENCEDYKVKENIYFMESEMKKRYERFQEKMSDKL